MESIVVYYIENRDTGGGRWYVKDSYGEVLGDYRTKKPAVKDARKEAKRRASNRGEVHLRVRNKNDVTIARYKYGS